MNKEAIQVGSTNMGLPFSAGIKFGNLLFIAGQGPILSGKAVLGDIKEQTKLTLDNFKGVVEKSGLSMDNVLSTTVYLTDLLEYSGMNEVYVQYFKEPRPARATVKVAELVFGMHVEISGIAGVP